MLTNLCHPGVLQRGFRASQTVLCHHVLLSESEITPNTTLHHPACLLACREDDLVSIYIPCGVVLQELLWRWSPLPAASARNIELGSWSQWAVVFDLKVKTSMDLFYSLSRGDPLCLTGLENPRAVFSSLYSCGDVATFFTDGKGKQMVMV